MGAMENDANRCSFMYADDRRCRNLVQNPGNPFCNYHNRKGEKDSRDVCANARAAEAFFDWLSRHPLDTATNVSEALNVLFFLVVLNRLSVRQTESLIRILRLALKAVPDVHREFSAPSLRSHQKDGERFLQQIRKTLLPAIRGEAEPPADPAPIPPPTAPDPAPPFRPAPFSAEPVEAPPPVPAVASALPSHGAPAAARPSRGGRALPAQVRRNRSAPRRAKLRRRKPPRRLGPASSVADGFAGIFDGLRTTPPSPARVAKLGRALRMHSRDPFRAAGQKLRGDPMNRGC